MSMQNDDIIFPRPRRHQSESFKRASQRQCGSAVSRVSSWVVRGGDSETSERGEPGLPTLDNNMKFFKLFKKKPPPSSNSPNLICNIHWAEVQRELSQDIMKDTLMDSNTGNGVMNNKNALTRHVTVHNNIGWNSAEEDNLSSESNSWSSISLSNSSKSNIQENLQEENFSRYVSNDKSTVIVQHMNKS